MIFSLSNLNLLVGLVLALVALMTAVDRAHPRRLASALFWGLFALVMLAGDLLAPTAVGAAVVAMALLAGSGQVRRGHAALPSAEELAARARRLGHRVFLPALAIAIVAVACTLLKAHLQVGGRPLLDPANPTLAAVGVGSIAALVLACALTRETPAQGAREARRLVDAIGWAIALPQMLAMLGVLFSQAGVGKAVAWLATHYIAMDIPLLAVAVYAVGMALFTIVLGNGFAAFPVMTGGVGVPVLVGHFHVDPAAMAAIGMFSGYCGTLMTPMAANFNIVPAALLELPDKNAVIRAQWPTALAVLAFNIVLLYFLIPRR
jgi:uncharacterized membrane protein